jgi:CYTH domain-containing protein
MSERQINREIVMYNYKLTRQEAENINEIYIDKVQDYERFTTIEGTFLGEPFKIKGNTQDVCVEFIESNYKDELIKLLSYMGWLPFLKD